MTNREFIKQAEEDERDMIAKKIIKQEYIKQTEEGKWKVTEKEFVKQAEEFGYTAKAIQDLLDLHKERGLPFEKMLLFEQTY